MYVEYSSLKHEVPHQVVVIFMYSLSFLHIDFVCVSK